MIGISLLTATLIMGLVGCGSSEANTTTPTTTEPYRSEPVEPNPNGIPYPSSPTTEISEFGRQATKDFLSELTTLFSLSFQFEDGTFGQNIAGLAHPFYPPLVSYIRVDDYPWIIYSDRFGNVIEDAPFLMDIGFVQGFAANASLYYLGNNGIPCIVILWGVPDTGAMRRELFRFIDGEFRSIGVLNASAYSFFYNTDGQLIVLYVDDYNGIHGYYYLTFPNNAVAHELIIAPPTYSWEAQESWHNHHTWQYFFEDPNPYMYGTNQPLERIFPLSELHDKLNADIVEWLRTEIE